MQGDNWLHITKPKGFGMIYAVELVDIETISENNVSTVYQKQICVKNSKLVIARQI